MQNNKQNNTIDIGRKQNVMSERIFVKESQTGTCKIRIRCTFSNEIKEK